MAGLSRGDLIGEYGWTDFQPNDSRVSGVPDGTHFNAKEGQEVLYIINALTKEWDLKNIKSGRKMERMLRDIPSEVCSQADVRTWIKDKWKSYKFKEDRHHSRPRQSAEETKSSEVMGEDHHFCAKCNCVTRCEVIHPSKSGPSPEQFAGVHYFKKHRKCASCNLEFETVEINSSLLQEMIRLRTLVAKIKSELDASSAIKGSGMPHF